MGELDPEQRFRAVMEKVLDRIASDPAFRQKLIEDSQVALSDAGMDKEVEELRALAAEEAEVGAYGEAAKPCPRHSQAGGPTSFCCKITNIRVSVE
jgi:hypothetical protein